MDPEVKMVFSEFAPKELAVAQEYCGHLLNYTLRTLSYQMNEMKAKIFNLVESSVTDPVQRKAMIGLVRGFASDTFNSTVDEANSFAKTFGYINPKIGTTDFISLDDSVPTVGGVA